MQTTSPQGEPGALGLESPLGRITHAAIQTETHLPYLHPDHDQWIHPRSKEGQTTCEESKSDPPVPQGGDTRFPREKVRSASPLLIRVSVDKRKEDFSPQRKVISTKPPHQHYHRTHTQDLRLFRCELSKVA